MWTVKLDAHGYLAAPAAAVEDLAAPCPPGWIFVETAPPALEPGQFARLDAAGAWSIDTDGPPAASPAVPAKVHKYWLTKVLEGLGEMDAIEDAMDDMAAAGNRTPRRDWQNATEVERANQLVNEFAALRGYTAEQVDQMFIQAAAYQAAAS